MNDLTIIKKLAKRYSLIFENIKVNSTHSDKPSTCYECDLGDRIIKLQINRNILTHIPPEIGELTDLEELYLNNNRIEKIENINNLINLKKLDLSHNRITKIENINNLSNLKHLDLYINRIAKIQNIDNLVNLIVIDLYDNQINCIENLSSLINLKNLFLGKNKISAIENIQNLINLEKLYIHTNKITKIENINSLIKLKELNLLDNQITSLDNIEELLSLKELNLYNNLLPNYLQSSIDKMGIHGNALSIINPYLSAKSLKDKLLNETKMIILGHGGHGKTTFRRIFTKEIQEPYQKELETHGIIQQKYELTRQEQEEHFYINIWDFGGQEMQYMTHQFFLTPDCLYILLCDVRREETNFDYWFTTMDALGSKNGQKSPIIVLLNHNLRNRTAEQKANYLFDDEEYKRLFPQFSGLYEVDFAQKDNRWESAEKKIVEQLKNLPIVKTPFPVIWQKFRGELQKEVAKGENYISENEFWKICKNNDIFEEHDRNALFQVLYCIGDIMYFDEIPDKIYLNPQWVANAIYLILKHPNLQEKRGLFTKEWLFEEWGKNGYRKADHESLLKLIQRDGLELCYCEDEASNTYLTPQGLKFVKRPEYEWDILNNLHFRFHYLGFFPKGILYRLMVRWHKRLAKNDDNFPLIWESGAIFEWGGAKAEVREIRFQQTQSIDIKVFGDGRKELLNQLRWELESMHEFLYSNKLRVKPEVPCGCTRNWGPHYFSNQSLINERKFNETTVSCPTCSENGERVKLKLHQLLEDFEMPVQKAQEKELAEIAAFLPMLAKLTDNQNVIDSMSQIREDIVSQNQQHFEELSRQNLVLFKTIKDMHDLMTDILPIIQDLQKDKIDLSISIGPFSAGTSVPTKDIWDYIGKKIIDFKNFF
jgi:Leucine-rich repeat (LRR) protein